VSILAKLEDDEPVDLFEVTSTGGAAYWRLYALDRFNGTTWSSSDPLAEQGQVLSSPASLQTTFLPPAAEPFQQQFHVLRDLDDPWLPMAQPAERITVPFGDIRYNPSLSSAVFGEDLDAGMQYSVTSRLVVPTPEELDLVTFDPPEVYGSWTTVPPTVDDRVRNIALHWTEDADTPYQKVLALQNRFRNSPFVYSLDVEPVADSDALLHFLRTSQRGFCQQFATAMAIMTRELGYPSRVAVGFREGTARGNTFTVDSRDAHAWVEVFFPGYGWLPFEPTPQRANPIETIPGSYSNISGTGAPSSEGDGVDGRIDSGVGGNCRNPSGRPLPPQLACRPGNQIIGPGRTAGGVLPPGFLNTRPLPEEEDGYSIPYRWIFLGLLTAGALVLVVTPVVKWTWRRGALARGRDARERVLAAYRVFDGVAADLGLGRRAGETVDEHRARIAADVAFSDGHLARLAQTVERAAYAPAEPRPDEARTAANDARTAIADVRNHAGLMRRIIGTYRPGL
jgi:transglutaminase-like putative cysteine protease